MEKVWVRPSEKFSHGPLENSLKLSRCGFQFYPLVLISKMYISSLKTEDNDWPTLVGHQKMVSKDWSEKMLWNALNP